MFFPLPPPDGNRNGQRAERSSDDAGQAPQRPRNRIAKWLEVPKRSGPTPIAISVVVPTGEHAGDLDDCLAALVSQDCAAGAYEVIVVDRAASKRTRQLVERWARASPVKFVYLPTDQAASQPVARNLGWRLARGQVIAFTDDDSRPAPTWLKIGYAGFAPDTAAVWGSVSVPAADVAVLGGRSHSGPGTAAFSTANLFCRRDVLVTVGGFDEQFVPPGRGELDLYLTLLDAGLPVRYVPEASVASGARPVSWASLAEQRRSMFHALLFKKHPVLYREKVQALPPCRYYATVAALLGAAVAITTGLGAVTEVCILVWLLLTLELADRRLRATTQAPAQVWIVLLTSTLLPPLAVFWRVWGAVRFRVCFV